MNLNYILEEIDKLQISNDSKEILKELAKRKIKTRRQLFFIAISGCMVAYYFFKFRFEFYTIFLNVLNNPTTSYLLIISTGFFIFSTIQLSHIAKELELLRKETIDKLNTDWMITEKSQLRDKISSFIKDNLNVNIRYKT